MQLTLRSVSSRISTVAYHCHRSIYIFVVETRQIGHLLLGMAGVADDAARRCRTHTGIAELTHSVIPKQTRRMLWILERVSGYGGRAPQATSVLRMERHTTGIVVVRKATAVLIILHGVRKRA